MHQSKDQTVPTKNNQQIRTLPSAAIQDAAGWQALYDAMLSHITGNVETWLKSYLTQMMAAGQPPQTVARGGPAEMSARGTAPGATAAGEMKFAVPPWLEPFKDPANVRFTRTPDHILVQEKELWAHVAAHNDDDGGPADRRPYVPNPNVRYSRTPDRVVARIEEPVASVAEVQDAAASPAQPPKSDAAPAPQPVPVDIAPVVTTAVSMAGAIADAYLSSAGTDESAVPVCAEPWTGAVPVLTIENPIVEDVVPEPEMVLSPAEKPWARMILLGGVNRPVWPLEQDNTRAALASFLVARDDRAAAEPDSEPAMAATMRAATVTLSDEVGGVVVAAAPIDNVGQAGPVGAGTPGAAVASPPGVVSRIEAFRPASMPGNTLHMAFLSGVNAAKPPRRPRGTGPYEHPPLDLLTEPVKQTGSTLTRDALEQHARLLEGVLEDFGIRGEIINVRPGPVVTLYELEPAPGIKSSRVVGLADDIARSMSAVSARVAVVQGRNAIGIELPNDRRDTVYLRELIGEPDFDQSKHKLAIALGKTIGGEPVIVDLARMPHLLVAGTTGSGKSVAINTMILSLLYRLKPEECRLIMVDPKMLELSIYDGIPHLLTPVVTDPKKAVVALKWAVREMEDRYKKMSKVGVRNIDGFNTRVTEAKAKGETIVRSVHTGFDRNTGQATYAQEEMDLTVLPYIVVIVDEMADLMMVAGKDIEGAIQRLAQMARAAGIHLIMATQRPSVDVITGTIKANFPTRISFQVTSKIDSRTILGEQGAEQLLGQGDMLHMMGGGRISRVHGPFVSDQEVELVVNHLKAQGQPDYLDVTTEEGEAAADGGDEEAVGDGGGGAVFDKGAMGADDNDLYDQGVKIVLRDKKCSTSYIQRRLSVGYNKAASLVERMEKEGIVGPANHAGKREILIYSRDVRAINISMPEDDDA